MELKEILTTLDQTYTREITTITEKPTITYKNTTNTPITINTDTTYNPQRICPLVKNNTTYLYINTIQTKTHSISISDIETLTTGE